MAGPKVRHDTLPSVLKDTLLDFYTVAGPMCNELCPFEALVAFKKNRKRDEPQQFKIHVDVCKNKESRAFVFHEALSLRAIQRKAFAIHMLLGQGWMLLRVFVGVIYHPFHTYADPIHYTMAGILNHVRDDHPNVFAGAGRTSPNPKMNQMWMAIHY